MPKITRPTRQQSIRMLDTRWSAYIRSYGQCEYCGRRDTLTDSHIIGRSYMKTRFDPRNNQCICFSDHGMLESQPVAFARWVESTSCGQYVDTMTIQANSSVKPDYELWFAIYDLIQTRQYSLEEARAWLGQHILLTTLDIAKLG